MSIICVHVNIVRVLTVLIPTVLWLMFAIFSVSFIFRYANVLSSIRGTFL